jgi:hypothetical protein
MGFQVWIHAQGKGGSGQAELLAFTAMFPQRQPSLHCHGEHPDMQDVMQCVPC